MTKQREEGESRVAYKVVCESRMTIRFNRRRWRYRKGSYWFKKNGKSSDGDGFKGRNRQHNVNVVELV